MVARKDRGGPTAELLSPAMRGTTSTVTPRMRLDAARWLLRNGAGDLAEALGLEQEVREVAA